MRNNTKEFVIIRENYSRILDNYSKLLEKFDLDNPVQISTMFSNMVEDGYLSVDKTFKFDRLNVYDYSGLGGTNIINGHGVCRHYSAFLTDILHNKDIDAVNLGVCFPDYGFHIELFDEKRRQTREEIYQIARKYFINSVNCDQLMDVIDRLVKENNKGIEVGIFEQKEKNIIKRILGNHAITFAYQKGVGYYLDPTMQRIYTLKEDGQYKLCDEGIEEIAIKIPISAFLNKNKSYKIINRHILNSSPSLARSDINGLVNNTYGLYQDNRDICEEFYRDNVDSYKEIAENLKLLKINFRSRR